MSSRLRGSRADGCLPAASRFMVYLKGTHVPLSLDFFSVTHITPLLALAILTSPLTDSKRVLKSII